jgi:hypothetical protein
MSDNLIDIEEFQDRQAEREELAFLWAERDALVAFIQRSDAHANFAKWALMNYADRVRNRSSKAIEWPFELHMADEVRSGTAQQFDREWIGLAEEFLADLEKVEIPREGDNK